MRAQNRASGGAVGWDHLLQSVTTKYTSFPLPLTRNLPATLATNTPSLFLPHSLCLGCSFSQGHSSSSYPQDLTSILLRSLSKC